MFRLEKENNIIKDIILTDIRNPFQNEEEEENYYKPVRVSNFSRNNYVEYESNVHKNKSLSVEEYLNKIRSYLKNINNLKKSNTWKILLAIENNFIYSTDNDVLHSKGGYIEIMINDEADVMENVFESLKRRYQNNLELMRCSEFVFDFVHLLYYKCHKINLNRGSYILYICIFS